VKRAALLVAASCALKALVVKDGVIEAGTSSPIRL
jgi:hypothetical protein